MARSTRKTRGLLAVSGLVLIVAAILVTAVYADAPSLFPAPGVPDGASAAIGVNPDSDAQTQANISVAQTAAAPTIDPGGVVTYTITVWNNGPDTATGVTLDDSISAGMAFGWVSAPGGLCTAPAVGLGGGVSCAIGDLASGASVEITLALQVALTTDTGPIANTATVRATSPEAAADQLDNNATTLVMVNAPAWAPPPA